MPGVEITKILVKNKTENLNYKILVWLAGVRAKM